MFEGPKIELSELDWRALSGAAVVLVFGLFIFLPAVRAVSERAAKPIQEQCYATTNHEGIYKEVPCKSFWVRTTDDPIAFFTLVLAASTIGLWIATWLTLRHARQDSDRQARDMAASLEISRKSLEETRRIGEAQTRAYLAPSSVELEISKHSDTMAKIETLVTLKNSGHTPAIFMFGSLSLRAITPLCERATGLIPLRRWMELGGFRTAMFQNVSPDGGTTTITHAAFLGIDHFQREVTEQTGPIDQDEPKIRVRLDWLYADYTGRETRQRAFFWTKNITWDREGPLRVQLGQIESYNAP